MSYMKQEYIRQHEAWASKGVAAMSIERTPEDQARFRADMERIGRHTQNKVKWEQGDEMLTPAGTVEIHSDEGDVIGFVFPQYAGQVKATPDLLAALEAFVEGRADDDPWPPTVAARAAIEKARNG